MTKGILKYRRYRFAIIFAHVYLWQVLLLMVVLVWPFFWFFLSCIFFSFSYQKRCRFFSIDICCFCFGIRLPITLPSAIDNIFEIKWTSKLRTNKAMENNRRVLIWNDRFLQFAKFFDSLNFTTEQNEIISSDDYFY